MAKIEKELVYRQTPKSRNAPRLAIFDFIERFYNPLWSHLTLGKGVARSSNWGPAPTVPRSLQCRRD